jgi:hypothetical protein
MIIRWRIGIVAGLLATLCLSGLLGEVVGLDSHPYLAGLVATFVGIVAGLPFALWLDARRLRQESRATRGEERERLRRVAGLLGDELWQATKTLGGLSMLPAGIRPPFIGFHVWAALSASGEIRGLSADMLAKLADAYRMIEATAEVQRDIYKTWNGPIATMIVTGGERRERLPPFVDLTNNLVEMREFAKVAVQSAIETINAAEAPSAGE